MKKILKNSHVLYLTIMAGLAVFFGLALGANGVLLWRAGEWSSARDVAQALQGAGMIYESGVHDVRKTLPLNIVRERRPRIIAFGSSRPLDFRQEYFTQPFACACQAMSQIDDGTAYAKALLKAHVPEVVIFTLDFWWFQDAKKTQPPNIDYETGPVMTLRKLVKPYALIADGTITVKDYLHLLTGRQPLVDLGRAEKSGLLAKIRGLGKRADGSLFFGIRLTDYAFEYYRQHADAFADPAAFIAHSERYGADKVTYDERIETLRDIVALFHEKGVKVVLVLPPIAPPIYRAFDLRTTHRRFAELPEKLGGIGDEFYDFHDPDAIGAGVCEFSDPHHAGDTAYMRLLREIVRRNPSSVIRNYIDTNRLSQYISQFAGLTIADFNRELEGHQERDFLGLGCPGKMKKPDEREKEKKS